MTVHSKSKSIPDKVLPTKLIRPLSPTLLLYATTGVEGVLASPNRSLSFKRPFSVPLSISTYVLSDQ